MLNLSIMPLDADHVDEVSEDIIEQERGGVFSHALFMIDDDVGLLYKPTKGCACRYHMAEFCRRAGVVMSREEKMGKTV